MKLLRSIVLTSAAAAMMFGFSSCATTDCCGTGGECCKSATECCGTDGECCKADHKH